MAIAVLGIGWRLWQSHSTAAWTDDQAVPTVQVIKLQGAKTGGELNLPGDVQAFTNAPIYAQVSGYVQKWYVDIGAPVKKGQLLAELDHARPGGPGRAKAAPTWSMPRRPRNCSAATATRYDALFAQGADGAPGPRTNRTPTWRPRTPPWPRRKRRSVQRLVNQENFRRLVAPFDGVVTSRAVDVGTLVTVGNADLDAAVHRRRPDQAAHLCAGAAELCVLHPARHGGDLHGAAISGPDFHATLVASAGAVASATGTVLVQFGLDNQDGALQPGAYAEVKFPLPAGANGIRVPATALMFRDEGMQVATVDATDHVKLKTVTIARDLGAAVDVGGGLSPKDRIIDNPADALQRRR